MRRQDITVGTEYAETGPLAYGAEPRTHATKIRFLSTDPSYRLAITYERKGEWGFVPVAHRIVDSITAAGLPDDVHRNRNKGPEGSRHELVAKYSTGELACERWVKEAWVPGMAKPAAVHRTWEQHEAERAERKRKAEEAFMQRAPRAITAQVESVLADALRFHGGDRTAAEQHVMEEVKRVMQQ